MKSDNSILLCSVIGENGGEVTNDDTVVNFKKEKKSFLAKRYCQTCAWREEQLRQVKMLKSKNSRTERALQNAADKIMNAQAERVEEIGLVRKTSGALTERQIRYGHILSHAIQCKTISHDEPNLRVNSNLELLKLHKLLKDSFPILYEKYPPKIVNDYSLIFKVPGKEFIKKKPIMLCAHLDVVPAPKTDDKAWIHDPFSGTIEDGIVWGRGAIDNKHNLVAILGALEEIIVDGNLPARTVYVACGHDEEIGGSEGAKYIAKQLLAENMNFEFILDEGTMMVSGIIPGYKEGPIALIGCAEKGFVNVEMTVTGPGGHSSTPPIDSDNPLKIMAGAIVALESNPIPPHFEKGTLFRDTLEHLARKVAFPFNIIFSNLFLFGYLLKFILVRASNGAAASIRTTTAVTKMYGGEKLNAMPSEVKAFVNHRVHPGDSIQSVLDHDRRVINDERVKLKIMEGATPPSPRSDHKTAGFTVISRAVERIFTFPSTPCLMVGNTDTRWYWDLSSNIYRFSPVSLTVGETAMFHGLNERISIPQVSLMADFYKEIILE